ncbi:hypothetical protein [Burkholderia glumae]
MSKAQLNRAARTEQSAARRIARLRRYGSRRTKTLIRQWGCCAATEILSIIRVLKGDTR